ncbi:MAG TPA: hypothetical protein VI854_00155 [Acidimicrobiia bacterium]|nr:hypothetical protein [Acidimicrobiia bacterium]
MNRPRRTVPGVAHAARVTLLAAAFVLLSAPPAFAHALDGAEPTNYRTRITGIEGLPGGVEIKVVEAGNRLEVSNGTGEDVVVPGYKEEPYLRIGPDGVFENRRSPATYLNRFRLPSGELPAAADENAAPEWRKISDARSARWHDHRTHWMGEKPPGPVQRNPGRLHTIIPTWEIPIRHGDGVIAVQGDLAWVPGPSRGPWLGVAAAAGVGLFVLARGRAGSRLTVAALALLVVFDVIRLAGLAGDSAGSFLNAAGDNPQAVAAWVTAALAAWRILAGDARLGLPLAAAAGVLFALGSFTDLNDLGRSQLPTTNPFWLARLAVAGTLGLGLGVVAAAATTLSAPPAREAVPAPAAEPT